VVPLSSDQDYRRLLAQQAPPLQPLPEQPVAAAAAVHPSASYFYPLGPAAAAALEQQWGRITGQAASRGGAQRRELPVMFGRNLHVVRRGCAENRRGTMVGWAPLQDRRLAACLIACALSTAVCIAY